MSCLTPQFLRKSTNLASGTPITWAILSKVYICGSTSPFSILLSVPLENPPSRYMRSCEKPFDFLSLAIFAPNAFKNLSSFTYSIVKDSLMNSLPIGRLNIGRRIPIMDKASKQSAYHWKAG